MINQDDITRARQADLATYLMSRNEPLIRVGRRYRHRDHDSLIFTDNLFYWNSKSLKGQSVDFLMMFYNFDFETAVRELTNQTPHTAKNDMHSPLSDYSRAEAAPEISDLKLNPDCKRAIAYLTKTRHIDYSVIQERLKSKHLYQEAETGNIIFPIYDEHNTYVGAEVQGTLSDVRFKGIKLNSKYGYGFNVRFPASTDNQHFDYALFFESAVDLISFIDIKTRIEKKYLERCILTSMSGLKLNVIKHTLNVFGSPNMTLKCVLAVDNDSAANNFRENVIQKDITFIDLRPPQNFKDWNEFLLALKNK